MICFPRRWVSCTVPSQHHVSKTCWVWIALQPPSVFHSLGVLRVKETFDRFGSCWHNKQGVFFLQQKEGACPTGTTGYSPIAARWGAEPWVLEPQRAAGILGTGAGTTTGRKHSRRIVCNLRRPGVKEASCRHSRLKFAAHLWDTCPQQLLLLHLPVERLSPLLLFSCFISSLGLTPCWAPLLGRAQLKSGQLLLSCMNSVDAKFWLENMLCWCFTGSGWFPGTKWGDPNWQN